MVNDEVNFDAKDLRVTFMAGDDIWALKFGSPGAFERFLQKCAGQAPLCCPMRHTKGGSSALHEGSPCTQLACTGVLRFGWATGNVFCMPALPCRFNKAAFENRYGQEQTDATEAKVGGPSQAVPGSAWSGCPASALSALVPCRKPLAALSVAMWAVYVGLQSVLPPTTPSKVNPHPLQLFGEYATSLNGVENDESRQHWVEDMDTDQPDPRVGRGAPNGAQPPQRMADMTG